MDRATVALLVLAAFSAAGAHGREQLVDFLNFSIFAGLILYALGTILWVYVLASEKLVNVYAFTTLSFVLVYLGGVLLLGEKLALG